MGQLQLFKSTQKIIIELNQKITFSILSVDSCLSNFRVVKKQKRNGEKEFRRKEQILCIVTSFLYIYMECEYFIKANAPYIIILFCI